MMYLGKQAVGANSISNVQQILSNNTLVYMGTVGTNGDFINLPEQHNIGELYKIISSGVYAGYYCLEGDYIFCTSDGVIANNSDWSILTNNYYNFILNEDVLEINYVQGGLNNG